jgi:hypothetical protein
MADFLHVRECGPSDDGTCLVLLVELQDGSLRCCHWPPQLLLPAMEEISPPKLAGNLREVLRVDSELQQHPSGGGSVH